MNNKIFSFQKFGTSLKSVLAEQTGVLLNLKKVVKGVENEKNRIKSLNFAV